MVLEHTEKSNARFAVKLNTTMKDTVNIYMHTY